MEREMQRRITIGFLVLLFTILVAYLLYPYDTTLLGAVFLAYLFYPVYRWTLRRTRREDLSAALTLLLIFLIVIIPLLSLVGVLANEARTFIPSLAKELDVPSLGSPLATVLAENPQLKEGIRKVSGEAVLRLAQAFGGVIGAVANAILNLVILSFVTFYLLIEGPKFCVELKHFVPLGEGQFDLVLNNVGQMIHALVYGQIVIAIVQGALGGVGFFLFGIPNAVLWGFVMMLLSFIPFVGSFLVWIPAGVYEILTGNTFSGVGILLWGAIVVSSADNLLRPRLVSGRAQVHPLVIILGVFGGSVRYGLLGIILGPLILSLFLGFLEPFSKTFLDQEAPEGKSQKRDPPYLPGDEAPRKL